MGIFRGVGGTGDSTTDSNYLAVQQKALEAASSAEEAAASATLSEYYSTIAGNKQAAAAASASSAASSATSATTQATAAETSATQAATSATESADSATDAASSATAAASSATEATSQAGEAATSATNAATSASNAASSASSALTYSNSSSTSATASAASASAAATSATNAATSATNAATSATASASSASAAEAAKDAALAALDSFDDRYLGAKASDPTVDNDGNPLVAGALYYDTTLDIMKVYEGSIWVAAYASLSGALLAANNLSDLNNVATARTNLGLSTTDDVTHGTITVDTLTLTGGTGTQGQVSWNADEETLDLIQNGATLQLGQEIQVHVRNNTGSNILNGTPVMATGTLGASGRITVAPMDGTTQSNYKYLVGIATEDIAAGTDGKVTSFGKVRNVNTSGYTAGSVLYISTSTAGALTATEPTSGMNMPCAFVINSHAVNGTLMVRVTPIDENAYATAAQGALADTALQSFTETDPVYTTSSWYTTTNNASNWNTAYSWGNHASIGYLTSFTESDPIYTASSWYTTTNNASNWNTAYSWGNHASAGYQASLVSGTNIKTVNGSSLLGSGNLSVSAAPGGADTQVQYNSAGAFAGSSNLTFNGTNLTCGGTITANSDESIKTNWREFDVDFVKQLAGIKHGTYDRTDIELTQDGVSAQSLQKLLPHSVLKNEEGILSVAYGNAALVAAIQLAQYVIKLEQRIAELEAK